MSDEPTRAQKPISRLGGAGSKASRHWHTAIESAVHEAHTHGHDDASPHAQDTGVVAITVAEAPPPAPNQPLGDGSNVGTSVPSEGDARSSSRLRFSTSNGRESADARSSVDIRGSTDARDLHTVVTHRSRASKRDSLVMDEEALAGAAGLDAKEANAHKKHARWLIDPHSRVSVYYRWYMGVLLLFVGFFLPLRIVIFPQEVRFYIFDWLIQWSYMIDMVLQFATAFVHEETGITCYEPKKIAIHYLKGRFIWDCIATLPWPAFVGSPAMRATKRDISTLGRLLWWLKMVKLAELYGLVSALSAWRRTNEGVVMVSAVLMLIALATHGLGCGWLMLGESVNRWCADAFYEGFPDDNVTQCTWIYRFGYGGQSQARRYLAAIYWALTTLATIGYGDISGRIWQEMIYAIVVEVIGTSWYAYIVGSWSTIMQNFDQRDKALQKRMQGIHAFARDNHLPPDLARSVRHHYRHAFQTDHWITYDGEEILNDLPSELRKEVVLLVEKEVIEDIPWLEGKDEAFVAELAGGLRPRRFEEGDYVFREGAAADNIYFLVDGRVDLISEGHSIEILSSGAVFGLVAVVENRDHRFTAQVVSEHAKCQALTEDSFCDLAERFPESFAELLAIAKSRVARLEKVMARHHEDEEAARKANAKQLEGFRKSPAIAGPNAKFKSLVRKATAPTAAGAPKTAASGMLVAAAGGGGGGVVDAVVVGRAQLERTMAALLDRSLLAMQHHVTHTIERAVKRRLELALREQRDNF